MERNFEPDSSYPRDLMMLTSGWLVQGVNVTTPVIVRDSRSGTSIGNDEPGWQTSSADNFSVIAKPAGAKMVSSASLGVSLNILMSSSASSHRLARRWSFRREQDERLRNGLNESAN